MPLIFEIDLIFQWIKPLKPLMEDKKGRCYVCLFKKNRKMNAVGEVEKRCCVSTYSAFKFNIGYLCYFLNRRYP